MPDDLDTPVLDGVYWPDLGPSGTVFQVGRECASPLEGGSYDARMSRVTRIEEVDDDGIYVERADGTSFRLVGCALAYVYKLNPIRVPLSGPEVHQLGSMAWQMERNVALSDDAQESYKSLYARAEKHNQLAAARAKTAELRAADAKDKALRELAGIKPLDEIQPGELDVGTEADEIDAREMLAGVQNGD